MEFTQETIDALSVNEVEIMKKIAEELNIRIQQVSTVISLFEEGNTVAFISRYRKDKTGDLDEVQVRDCDHLYKSYHNLEDRRLEIVKGVFAQGKLTETLYNAIMSATTLSALEDLWAPFKKKKKTRGMVAQEKGLEPLADAMLKMDDSSIEKEAEKFVKTDNEDPALNVETAADAWTFTLTTDLTLTFLLWIMVTLRSSISQSTRILASSVKPSILTTSSNGSSPSI